MRRNYDPSTIFMNATLVATVAKNKLEEIRIAVLRNNKIDVRTYMFFPDANAMKPTRKGLWLSFKHIPPIVAAFEKYLADPAKDFCVEFDVPEKEEKIRAYVGEFKGAKIVHIRTFFLDKQGELQPGKGISFPVALLAPMLEAFKALEKYRE